MRSASAHKVHHLQAIAFRDRRFAPLASRYNLQVELDGHAVTRKLQPIQHGKQRQAFWHLARFTVQMNFDHTILDFGLVP